MFEQYRNQQHQLYNNARAHFVANPAQLINLEHYFISYLQQLYRANWAECKKDYDEASYLFPFWENYPPDHRGRQPKGDQYPWIEVGEHAIGEKLPRYLIRDFKVRDTGIPTGADQRFLLTSEAIAEITGGYTDSVFLSVDVKSAGPRDNAAHVVMSHNQISGDGIWASPQDSLSNNIITATGTLRTHSFHCSLPPVYVLSDGTIAPVINIALKPIYSMLSLTTDNQQRGQPLDEIKLICIPNGLLLLVNPNYLSQYPALLFPGKDAKSKNPLKVRARVSFNYLQKIDKWRVCNV